MRTLTMRVAAVGGLLFFLLPAAAGAQSLGEIARKLQAEKKEQGTKGVKVYTNDNIPHAATIPQVPEATGATSTAGQVQTGPKSWNPAIGLAQKTAGRETASTQASEAQQPAESKMKTKEYWQQRFLAARRRLARAEEEATLSQNELSLLNLQKARTLDPNQISSLDSQISAKQTELAERQADTAKAQKALDELEKEFKESGAPEDWSRTP